QNGAVRTVEMLPAHAVGMLSMTYEFDASRKHGLASDIEIVDPESDHRARREEAVKFVCPTVNLQNRAVGELEPDLIAGLSGDGYAKDIAKERNGFIQPFGPDADETYLRHCHRRVCARTKSTIRPIASIDAGLVGFSTMKVCGCPSNFRSMIVPPAL